MAAPGEARLRLRPEAAMTPGRVRRPELAVGLALLALFGGMVVAASSYPGA